MFVAVAALQVWAPVSSGSGQCMLAYYCIHPARIMDLRYSSLVGYITPDNRFTNHLLVWVYATTATFVCAKTAFHLTGDVMHCYCTGMCLSFSPSSFYVKNFDHPSSCPWAVGTCVQSHNFLIDAGIAIALLPLSGVFLRKSIRRLGHSFPGPFLGLPPSATSPPYWVDSSFASWATAAGGPSRRCSYNSQQATQARH